MKSATTTIALSSLLFSIVALTSFQASSASLQSESRQPLLMLAEGGSDRLIQHRELQAQRERTTEDESERFAQLVEEKPTAAGSGTARDATEPATKPASHYKSRIHHRPVSDQY